MRPLQSRQPYRLSGQSRSMVGSSKNSDRLQRKAEPEHLFLLFFIHRLHLGITSHSMSSEPIFVLPGDRIDASLIPSHEKKPLRLGPGLRHVPPSDLVPTLAGQLVTDRQKNAIRVETANGRVRLSCFLTLSELTPTRSWWCWFNG